MKRLVSIAVTALALAAVNSSANELDWLAGCWASPDGSAREVWVIEGEQSLAGFGVAINNGEIGFYEILSIRQGKDEEWIYTAHPSGQSAASFKATHLGNNSVVFTNPDHDYPQEISYQRKADRLTAVISLLDGINPNSFEKVVCE